MRGAASRIQATAPTKGGMKIGMVASFSRKPLPGRLVRANSHASGTPTAHAIAVAPSPMIRVLSSAIQ